MKRVGDVLGKDWELYAESQKLQSESTLFKEARNRRALPLRTTGKYNSRMFIDCEMSE